MSVHDTSEQAAAEQGKAYAARIWQYKQSETVAIMLYVGRRLGKNFKSIKIFRIYRCFCESRC